MQQSYDSFEDKKGWQFSQTASPGYKRGLTEVLEALPVSGRIGETALNRTPICWPCGVNIVKDVDVYHSSLSLQNEKYFIALKL